ncbi:MAG: hypothetical protein IKP20_00180 [Candidatus Methanomethylophilaceae archaeon]|nr:hypothetical protein [Candidatus Methanomethylophilaceae archaeon]
MDKKIIAIIAVVAVAAAAIIAAVLLTNGGGEKEPTYEYEGRLPILGNANNDDYINDDDVKYIQDIIDGKVTGSVVVSVLDSYDGKTINRSLADANADGAVDSKDLELVKKMVKREHGIKINYINVDNVLSTCNYPLTTIGLAYKTIYEMAAAAGLTSNEVKWVCDSVGDVPGKGELRQWYPQFSDAKCFGNRATPTTNP